MKSKKIKLLIWSSICLSAIANFGDSGKLIEKKEPNKYLNNTLDYTYQLGTEEYSVNGIGYGINLTESNSLNLVTSLKTKNFIKNDILISVINNGKATDIKNTTFTTTEANSVTNLAISLAAEYKNTTKAGLSTSVVSCNVDKSLGISGNISFSQKKSQYYKVVNAVSTRYSFDLGMTDYSSITNDITNYDSGFIKYLNEAYASGDFSQVFENFGSHIISAGYYGANFYASASAATNKVDIGAALKVNYSSGASVSKSDTLKASEAYDFNIEAKIGYTLDESEKYFNIQANGGDTIQFGDIDNDDSFSTLVLKSYNDWASTVNDNIVLTSVADTIPLWELLPEGYDASTMKNAFNSYCLKNMPSYNAYNYTKSPIYYAEGINTYATEEDGEKVKYDSPFGNYFLGIKTDSNPVIELYMPDEFGWCYDVLTKAGYTYVKVDFVTDIREVDDGYQYFYLYDGNFSKNDHEIAKVKYEHVPNKCGTEWGKNISFSFGNFKLSELSGLKNSNKFYVGFGSGGNAQNNWRFRNFKVKLTFTKC